MTNPTSSTSAAGAVASPGYYVWITLFALTGTALAFVLGARWMEAKQQREAVEAIERSGGRVLYDYEVDHEYNELSRSDGRELDWSARVFGRNFTHQPMKVDANGLTVSEEQLTKLRQIESLEAIDLRSTGFHDGRLPDLLGFSKLQWVDMRDTDVTDEGVTRLRTQLPTLTITFDPTTAAGLRPFVRRAERRIEISGTADTGLGSLPPLTQRSTAEQPPIDAGPVTIARSSQATQATARRPSPVTERAIDLGLSYLAGHQLADGSWSLHRLSETRPELAETYAREQTSLQADTAATGLALLSFLGAGYHHMNDDMPDPRYQQVVRRGLDFLQSHQQLNGDLYVMDENQSAESVRLYSHGIAALALTEAYGMTQDPRLCVSAQLAIDFIVDSQHPELGGWRYVPGKSSDTSVTGWMTIALMSAQLAGLHVPPVTFERIERWLEKAKASNDAPHLFVYNPDANLNPQQRHGRQPSPTMTAVGALMRLYLNWGHDDPQMVAAADYFLARPPRIGTAHQPLRDTYYWFYATQVMFHMRGEHWESWNKQLHGLLIDNQVQQGPLAGSWDPARPVPDRWGSHAGRVYVTTLNLLSLEVYHRHLPIYEQLTK